MRPAVDDDDAREVPGTQPALPASDITGTPAVSSGDVRPSRLRSGRTTRALLLHSTSCCCYRPSQLLKVRSNHRGRVANLLLLPPHTLSPTAATLAAAAAASLAQTLAS